MPPVRGNSQHWNGLSRDASKTQAQGAWGLEGVHHRGTVTVRAAERESHLGITITSVT